MLWKYIKHNKKVLMVKQKKKQKIVELIKLIFQGQ